MAVLPRQMYLPGIACSSKTDGVSWLALDGSSDEGKVSG